LSGRGSAIRPQLSSAELGGRGRPGGSALTPPEHKLWKSGREEDRCARGFQARTSLISLVPAVWKTVTKPTLQPVALTTAADMATYESMRRDLSLNLFDRLAKYFWNNLSNPV